MANKMDAKTVGLTVLMGSGVIILTPIIAGFASGIEMLSFEIVPSLMGSSALTVGTALSAGIAAFVMDLAITKWLR